MIYNDYRQKQYEIHEQREININLNSQGNLRLAFDTIHNYIFCKIIVHTRTNYPEEEEENRPSLKGNGPLEKSRESQRKKGSVLKNIK